ncbi:MAG: hypothetical protein KMY54_04395 [Erysipelothrix sp.]|nr:hypothetical protein [Erysipelothrix sp.]
MKVLICGILGKMGRLVAHQVLSNPQLTLIGGVDFKGRQCAEFAVYSLSDAPLADVGMLIQ